LLAISLLFETNNHRNSGCNDIAFGASAGNCISLALTEPFSPSVITAVVGLLGMGFSGNWT